MRERGLWIKNENNFQEKKHEKTPDIFRFLFGEQR